MTIPVDAPKGEYTVSVGVQTSAGAWLSAVDSSGKPIDFGIIPVGKLQVD